MAYDAGGLVVVRDKVEKEIETLTLQKPHRKNYNFQKLRNNHACLDYTYSKKTGYVYYADEFIS